MLLQILIDFYLNLIIKLNQYKLLFLRFWCCSGLFDTLWFVLWYCLFGIMTLTSNIIIIENDIVENHIEYCWYKFSIFQKQQQVDRILDFIVLIYLHHQNKLIFQEYSVPFVRKAKRQAGILANRELILEIKKNTYNNIFEYTLLQFLVVGNIKVEKIENYCLGRGNMV